MVFEENKVKETYFDKYEGIHSEISQVTRFDENTDLSTTYLGKRGQTRKSIIRAEESFPISGQGYTVGKLADKTNCNILIDTGASQSYMSKSFYMQSKILHALPKLQQNLSKNYHFESVEKLCEEFNAIVNERKKLEEKVTEEDKYLWLDDSDERKYMTDGEILEKYINLDNWCLTESEKGKKKVQLRDMIYKYKEVFSLRDEIGTCPNIEIDIDVTDKMPFFIRPYQVKEEDKRVLDKEMKRLCYLGILKEGFSAYSSPVMLVSRKLTQDKRVVTDFRHLNTRIAKNNLAYLLVKDTCTTLGNSKCEVLSVLDLKDAFHSLRLSEKSKKYCGILPYFCSASYMYQRMPMGLNVSPLMWQSYINTILNCLENRKYCEAIMDDLLLFTPSKQMHMRKLEDLLKALLKNGLKISPRKWQLFKTELQYMGNTIFIQGKRVCVKPLPSRLEAIQKLEPPKTIKGCRSFAGMVHFLSIFCQDLQKL